MWGQDVELIRSHTLCLALLLSQTLGAPLLSLRPLLSLFTLYHITLSMVAIGDKKITTPAADHISALDADRAVEALQTFAFAQHGSTHWQRQHEDLTRLNVQAHLNAQHHRDEFVVEAILLHQKMPLLIREIVAADLYKQHAFPRLKEWLATNASIKGYLLLYNEAVLANLLEAALYHPRAAISAGDAAAELVDWCHRRLGWERSSPHRRQAAHSTQQFALHDGRPDAIRPPGRRLRRRTDARARPAGATSQRWPT